jgi:hypothetical protein
MLLQLVGKFVRLADDQLIDLGNCLPERCSHIHAKNLKVRFQTHFAV